MDVVSLMADITAGSRTVKLSSVESLESAGKFTASCRV